MRLVYGGIGSNKGDAVFLFFDALNGGFFTADKDDGNVPAINIGLLANDHSIPG